VVNSGLCLNGSGRSSFVKRYVAIFVLLSLGLLAQNPPAKAEAGQPANPLGDFSGMYTFLREGEFVQIDMEEQGRITGFISRYGDLDSDRGAFLDHMIKKGSWQGNKLSFSTVPIHGIAFEFTGTVERGEGKTPGAEAYYVLKGTLTQLTTDANKKTYAKSRAVVFKSFPQDVQAPPKKD
jgi:hypothetical protein